MGSRDPLRASRIHRTGLRFRFRGVEWGRVLGKGIVPFTDRSPRCRGGLEIHPANINLALGPYRASRVPETGFFGEWRFSKHLSHKRPKELAPRGGLVHPVKERKHSLQALPADSLMPSVYVTRAAWP